MLKIVCTILAVCTEAAVNDTRCQTHGIGNHANIIITIIYQNCTHRYLKSPDPKRKTRNNESTC